MKSVAVVKKALEPHVDQRGALYEVYRRDMDGFEARQVYFSTSRPEVIRGNHYHMRKVESFSVVRGRARLFLVDVEGGQRTETILDAERPELVIIRPGTAHAIQSLGPETMILLILVSEEFKPEKSDTTPYQVI
jgi:UDP-2-acetamido-2,6-beta-L-arabino-hexul-4-ose reductase